MLKIRLARAGSKKRPFYRVVVANNTAPRDGDFIEKLGTYNPLLNLEDSTQKIILNNERVEYWLNQGAQPTETIFRLIKGGNVAIPAKIVSYFESKVAKRVAKPPKKQAE